LTNYSINKDHQLYRFNTKLEDADKGHKRSMTSILNYLRQKGHDTNHLMNEIKTMFVKTFAAGQPILAH
jgi:tubulin polyglutamylase TTLL6/13